MFDWASQPLYTLILTFLFAPYFATAVASSPERGQALWGYGAAIAGILIALGSPFLGALADSGGRRKPWIALFALVMAASMSALWWAEPNAGTTTVLMILVAFVLATAAAEFATVFTNAMMPTLATPDQLGRLSGLGYAVGYAGGLASLVIMAGLVVTSPSTGKTLLGLDPILVLDAAAREGDRLVGPFAAIWFILFMVPFFLLVPDIRIARADRPARAPLAELVSTIKGLAHDGNMVRFLLARMVYVDGLSAIFTFGGIYGTAVFGWTAFELGLFGIILSVTGAIGAVVGGFLDDRIGAKRVIVIALTLLLAAAFGILSVTATHVLYNIPVTPRVAGAAPFSSTGELVYLGFAMIIGFVAAPIQAASRSLLARLAPPDKITQYFGLFAFSGKVTAFAAPLLVATVTQATGSQRLGVAVIIVFLAVGLLMMFGVRERPATPLKSREV
jgi:UMF1 family MFS transporter